MALSFSLPRRAVSLAALVLCLPGAALAEQSVTWITHPMPPAFIAEGPDAGQGVGDLQLRFLIRHLSRYGHHVQRSSFARIWTQMAQLDGVCAQSVFISPERRRVAVFTRRALREVGYRLYARTGAVAKFAPYLTPAGEIDFARLAQGAPMQGAYYATRLLPDPIVDPTRAAGAQTVLQSAQSTRQLLQLLDAGRIDFFLAVGNEVSYVHRDDMTNYVIHNVPAFNDVYIACSDKPIGRSVIAQIDDLQSRDDLWAEFVEPMKRWHTAAEVEESLASRPRTASR